ncbi:MAG: thioredoxin-disulfide reductase [Caldisericaceae bacterium]
MDELAGFNVQVNQDEIDTKSTFDVVIIGAGPGGLTAAIYSGRSKLKTLVLEKLAAGGQIAVSELVENYPGFPEGISGTELTKNFGKQALRFGAKILTADVRAITKKGNLFYTSTEYGDIASKSVIIATGADPVKLPVQEEETFRGRGISYCATCDGSFFKGKVVAVVGGGDTALYDAIYLTKFAEKVILVHRRQELRACKSLQDRAASNKKIVYELQAIPVSIKGEGKVEALIVENVTTHERKEIPLNGVFVAIGTTPNSKLFENLVKLNPQGYIITNPRMETSTAGLYAVGDVRESPLKQVVTACGDGAIAAFEAEKYLSQK